MLAADYKKGGSQATTDTQPQHKLDTFTKFKTTYCNNMISCLNVQNKTAHFFYHR